MKILLIGASGTIGRAVTKQLKSNHEVISVGHTTGDIRCDFTSTNSIKKMYQDAGSFDALAVAAGGIVFKPLTQMNLGDYKVSIEQKLLSQVNLVLEGQEFINENGSFTLISGILSQDARATCSAAALVNGALESFTKTAAVELARGVRINCICPNILKETFPHASDIFEGATPVSSTDVAKAYAKSIEGDKTGEIYVVL